MPEIYVDPSSRDPYTDQVLVKPDGRVILVRKRATRRDRLTRAWIAQRINRPAARGG